MKLTKIAWLVTYCGLSSATYAVEEPGAEGEQSVNSTVVQSSNQSIAPGLSDFQWFRVFPYVDKGFALAEAGRIEEALAEIERARNIVPDHLPLALHHAELLIANGSPQLALNTLQPFIGDAQARRVYISLLARPERLADLSIVQFFDELETLDAGMQAVLTNAYLANNGRSLTTEQLVKVAELHGAANMSSELLEQIAEYLLQRDGAEEVVRLLEPICRAEHSAQCSLRQRMQLTQALVVSEQLDGIEQWLLTLQGDEFEQALDMTVNRMIGTQRNAELIRLLSKLDAQGALNEAWGQALFLLAADQGETGLALRLAQRYSVNCLLHTELLLQAQQLETANQRLSDCDPTAGEEARYLVLAQAIGDPQLLERVSFNEAETENRRIRLLVDQYRGEHQRDKLIQVLEADGLEQPELQRLLAQVYYQHGQVDQALALSAKRWREYRDLAALDDHTFMLLNEQRYEALAAIAVTERWGEHGAASGDDVIGERVSIGIEHAHQDMSSDVLVTIAQRWPGQRLAEQVSDVLLQRQDCESAVSIRQDLTGQAGYHLDSYCLRTAAERLQALEQYSDNWGDEERLRAAVLAYDSADYDKSLTYLDGLSKDMDPGLFKPLQLSAWLALGQIDEAWAQWQALAMPLTKDESILGVDIALQRGDRESVHVAMQRIEDSVGSRTTLPLQLRLAEIDNDLAQQLIVFEQLAAENPDESYYPLAQAFVLERMGGYGSAGRMFDQTFAAYPQTRNGVNLQQAAYVNAQARRDTVAKEQLEDIIDTEFAQGQQASEMLTHSQRFYRQVQSPFSATIAGWLGQSTNVSQVTGNDFQADYFLSTTVEYDFDYGRERRTNLVAFVNLLSAGDSFFFNNNSLDAGVAWQPVETHLTFVRLATRTSFDGGGTRLYLRGSTDLLASVNTQKSWGEDSRFVDHSLYLDWLFFPDEQTSSVYARYQPTFQFAGAQRSFFKIGAYPFIQFQWTEDTFNQQGLADTRVGLGVTWRQPLGTSRYAGWRAFSELGLEWQHVMDSDIAGVSDNALLLRFAVFF